MSTHALRRRFLNCALIVLVGGCGARTGPEVPTFIDRRPEAPPPCRSTPPTITVVPDMRLPTPATLPVGRQGMRFVDWRISVTCADGPNPPNSDRIGPRRILNCNIIGGTSGLATSRRITGDCVGFSSTGTPASFQVDDTVPGQPGTLIRQFVAMRITGGNVCIRGTVTFGNGSTQPFGPAMWRVTTVGAPTMGFVVGPDGAGGTLINPVGLVSRGCRFDV